MSDILIVEDNPLFREGATSYFFTQSGVQVHFAVDYDDAITKLGAEPVYGAAIVDCFFPKKTGSNDVSLGRGLVEKMALSDPRELKMRKGLEVLAQDTDLTDPVMMNYARYFVSISNYKDLSQSPVIKALRQVIAGNEDEVIRKKTGTLIFKKTFDGVCANSQISSDYYGALLKAMDESEANQPLGILAAERIVERGISFILATSTYHHDILTQPIQNYAIKNGWTLVDCNPDNQNHKATLDYWKNAFLVLQEQSKL
ncbi:MAG TPA: response regulator [Candidatus Nanoarchaeia archaeon]|nr:response regulator [Candidatus Nanoarchaeia archaeon]